MLSQELLTGPKSDMQARLEAANTLFLDISRARDRILQNSPPLSRSLCASLNSVSLQPHPAQTAYPHPEHAFMKTRLLALSLTVGLLPLNVSAANVTFINQSAWDIYQIYVSPANEDHWGEDQLDAEVLEHGDSLILSNVPSGRWDVLIIDEDNDECIIKNTLIEADDTWEITDEALLLCQSNS